jgi:hypothetical protein
VPEPRQSLCGQQFSSSPRAAAPLVLLAGTADSFDGMHEHNRTYGTPFKSKHREESFMMKYFCRARLSK